MPTTETILDALTAIANGWRPLAIFWHVYVAALLVPFLAGARPSRRLVGGLLCLPLFSVSVLAWAGGNPFNGSLFALTGTGLLAIALRWRGPAAPGPGLPVVAGSLLIAFGWVYPHFLTTESPLPYLYAAPLGLVPCPTLSAVVGFGLLLDGLGSRAWSLLVAAAGAFYGLFGALKLDVTIDWVLFGGALLLAARTVTR